MLDTIRPTGVRVRTVTRTDNDRLLLQPSNAVALPTGYNGHRFFRIGKMEQKSLFQIFHWIAFTVITFACALLVHVTIETPLTMLRRCIVRR